MKEGVLWVIVKIASDYACEKSDLQKQDGKRKRGNHTKVFETFHVNWWKSGREDRSYYEVETMSHSKISRNRFKVVNEDFGE